MTRFPSTLEAGCSGCRIGQGHYLLLLGLNGDRWTTPYGASWGWLAVENAERTP